MKYVEPEMEIVVVKQDDVIRTSGLDGSDPNYTDPEGGDHTGWIPTN